MSKLIMLAWNLPTCTCTTKQNWSALQPVLHACTQTSSHLDTSGLQDARFKCAVKCKFEKSASVSLNQKWTISIKFSEMLTSEGTLDPMLGHWNGFHSRHELIESRPCTFGKSVVAGFHTLQKTMHGAHPRPLEHSECKTQLGMLNTSRWFSN